MTFAVFAGRVGASRWAKWIDVDAASRWGMALESLVTRADTSSLFGDEYAAWLVQLERDTGRDEAAEIRMRGAVTIDGAWSRDRYARQLARITEIATAVRAFGLACDLDVFGLGAYAPARIAGDDGGSDFPALYTEFGAWRREVWALLQATNGTVRDAVASGGDVLLDLFARVDFAAVGDGSAVSVRDDVIDPPSGSDRRELLTVDPHGWSAWSGCIVKTWAPPGGAASARVEVTVLLPLSFSWALFERVARSLIAGRINGAMARSQAWCFARNARLSRVLGGEGLPETVVEASAAVDVAALGGDSPLSPEVEALVSSVVAVVAAINPVAGLVLGVVMGVGLFLARILPRATAFASDAWGRRQPFLQPLAKSGTLAPRAAPTHALEPVPALFARVEVSPAWADGLMSPDVDPVPPVEEPLAGDSEGSGSGGGFLVLGGLALLARVLLGS